MSRAIRKSPNFISDFENILIFYRATDESVEIARLMHGARDLPRRLRQTTA